MVSKYKNEILKVVNEKIMSTNEILKKLESKHKKVLSWHIVYRNLRDLKEEGKIELLEATGGIYWRKK